METASWRMKSNLYNLLWWSKSIIFRFSLSNQSFVQ